MWIYQVPKADSFNCAMHKACRYLSASLIQTCPCSRLYLPNFGGDDFALLRVSLVASNLYQNSSPFAPIDRGKVVPYLYDLAPDECEDNVMSLRPEKARDSTLNI